MELKAVIPLIIAVTISAVGILNAVLFWFMPRLTRQDLYFAVTVAPRFRDSPEGKSILRRYRTELTLVCGLALAAAVVAVAWLGVGLVPGGFFLQLAASFIAFYRARQRVLPYAVAPTTIREAELHGRSRIIPGGWMVASGPFVLLAACAAYLRIHREEIAARFTSVYLLSTAGMLAALTILLYGMSHWVRSVHAGGPEGARELKFRRTVSAILLVTEYFITLQASCLALGMLHHDLRGGAPGGIVIVLLPLFLVLVLVMTVALARLGQGGSRVSAANETPSAISAVPVGDRTPDDYWKLGVLYFNRDDPAVIVEKRFGLGYTLNFARPATWVILLLLLLGPLVPVLAHLSHFLTKIEGR
jgi:uncharacterized membrane protein